MEGAPPLSGGAHAIATAERRGLSPRLELAAFWALSRLWILLLSGRWGSDSGLYEYVARGVLSGGMPYRDVPVDHPPLAVALMMIPLAASAVLSYATAFRILALVFDAAAFFLLDRLAGVAPDGARRRALWLYVWLSAAAFPFLFERIDAVVMALLAALALAGVRGRIKTGYALAAACVGVNVGLWPLFPFWLVTDRWIDGAWRKPLGRFVVAVALVLAVTAGLWAATGSGASAFLTYHWRGDAVASSVGASLALTATATGHGPHTTLSSGALRVAGTAFLGPLGLALLAALVAVMILVFVRRTVGPPRTEVQRLEWMVAGIVACVTAFLVTTAALFPQYVFWAVPLLALGAFLPRASRWWAAAALGAAVVTTVAYRTDPFSLLALRTGPLATLWVRSALLLVLMMLAARRWRASLETKNNG